MSENVDWTVRAYLFKNGEYKLSAWVSGLDKTHADKWFDDFYATNQYAKIVSNQISE
jgi:hypothetical protein